MARWHPSLDLARLLDALSGEILAASDEEVRQTSGRQGWTIANTALDVRQVIKAARGDVTGNLNRTCDRNEDPSEPGARLRPTRRGRGSLHNQRH
ncbi:hypothetical protein [Bradyrhizobium sp. 162]|uniref:hypothetical protein n=1 Tax=Bradyrhizobium sp. 162 TaxID=2782635 RepID=UPI001FFC210B|nr:hypothetical protein [Bradyrhizobium sp. 162]MCK1635420.1 hypothetical protein [Bradyrhizobium sp. 162]